MDSSQETKMYILRKLNESKKLLEELLNDYDTLKESERDNVEDALGFIKKASDCL